MPLPRFGLAVEWMSVSASEEPVDVSDDAKDLRAGWRAHPASRRVVYVKLCNFRFMAEGVIG